MAVLPMKRVLICGLKKNRKHILELLQRRDVIEIDDTIQEDAVFQKTDMSSAKVTFEKNASIAGQALEILNRYQPEKTSMLSSLEGRREISLEEYNEKSAHYEEIMKTAYRLLALEKQISEDKAGIPKLEAQLESLVPWENFDLPLNFKGTKKTAVFVGSFPKELTIEEIYAQLSELASEVNALDVNLINASKEMTSIYVICRREDEEKTEEALRKMGFEWAPNVAVNAAKRKAEILEEIQQLNSSVQMSTDEVAIYADQRDDMKFIMDYYTMRAEKYSVLSGLVQSQRVFFITGYIAEQDVAGLKRLLESKFDVEIEVENPQEGESVPVQLKNNAFVAPMESVVESYSMPARGELDPCSMMAFFYYFLFGMMLSDAAYGIMMAGACGFCLKKFKNMEDGMKKMMTLFFYCGISTMLWGFAFGGFFGDVVNVVAATFFKRPDIQIPALWFQPVNEPMRMLVFSLLVGIIHLFLGLGLKLYSCIRAGKWLDGIYDVVFWYMLVGGGVIYMLTVSMVTNMLGLSFTLPAGVGTVAAIAAGIGAVGILFTSGRESKNWVKRILKGAYGLYGVTSYISDILSYSRLLALGLATGVIATVFNKMGSMVGGGIIGAIVFLLVFIVGHMLNLAINALGAYVHTNRLQYVEFFGKFYEGGGRRFMPFGIHTKYFKVKKEEI